MVKSALDFKQAQHKLGLSDSELGAILNTNLKTIRLWKSEHSDRSPNPVACRVMEWMLAGFRPPQWPKNKNKPMPQDPTQKELQ
jgi:ribosome-binding protein aMBF1 (putative translation factor)